MDHGWLDRIEISWGTSDLRENEKIFENLQEKKEREVSFSRRILLQSNRGNRYCSFLMNSLSGKF